MFAVILFILISLAEYKLWSLIVATIILRSSIWRPGDDQHPSMLIKGQIAYTCKFCRSWGFPFLIAREQRFFKQRARTRQVEVVKSVFQRVLVWYVKLESQIYILQYVQSFSAEVLAANNQHSSPYIIYFF